MPHTPHTPHTPGGASTGHPLTPGGPPSVTSVHGETSSTQINSNSGN